MATTDRFERIRIYVNEADTWEQKPLYLAVMELLQREGATGATAVQGKAGFGPARRVASTGLARMDNAIPVVIEWIDRAERIAKILPHLDEMLAEALITTEEIKLHRAVIRSQGPFSGEHSVSDIMQAQPQSVTPTASLGKAINIMLASNQFIVPVIDERRKIVGVIHEACIARRAGLLLPLRLVRLLTKEEGLELLSSLVARPVSEVMDTEWHSVHAAAFIPQALVLMVEWNDDQIIVLDRDDTLLGLLGWSEVLTAFIEQSSSPDHAIRHVEQPTPVSLVMQYNVPQILVSQPLGVALQQLLAAPDRYLIVVNQERQVLGSISDIGVFRSLSSAERVPLIQAIQKRIPLDLSLLPSAQRSLEIVLDRSTPKISPKESITNTVRRLIELRLERAPVVDEEGKLQGLIARGGLLRALIHESK